MRRGELLALRWPDVDLDAGVIHVERSVTQVRQDRIYGTPKNHEKRDVAVDQHLVARQRRASGRAARRIADGGGEITDEQHCLMAEQLELAELFQSHRVAEVNVRRGGIDAQLDPQRAAEAKFFQKLFFRENFGGAGCQLGELLFRRHGCRKS